MLNRITLCLFGLLSLFAWTLPPSSLAQGFNPSTAPLIGFNSIIHPSYSREGMVASSEQVASEVGARILAQGGNAVDAAVATGFALAVTYPMAGNLGGGGFMVIHLAETQQQITLDYREMAPQAAYRDMFLDEQGNADPYASRSSLKSTGVPGTVAGLLYALDKWGSMSRAQVLQPAIELAEKGIVVTFFMNDSLSGMFGSKLRENPASKGYFYKPDGTDYQPGEILRQTDLAATLKRIAEQGSDGFYRGATADAIVAEMVRDGGLITHDDLQQYRVVEREAIRGQFMGYDIITMPPPSSGGVHLVQMLNVLEGYPLKELAPNSAAYLHLLTETMKYAYADRSRHLGDPDFYPVPVAELTSKEYAAQIRSRIKTDRATPAHTIAPASQFGSDSPQTTHYAVIDGSGNVVSNTYTLNGSFGNGRSVPGAGFLLNNEMDDFSAKPGTPNMFGLLGGDANKVEARKRPLSSMTPTIVLKDGQPVLATGAPGGSRIITVVLQIVLNHLVYDMNIAEATLQPRIHHQWEPDLLFSEPGIGRDTLDKLESMGHVLGNVPYVLGNSSSIARRDGVLSGLSDTRRPGGSASSVEDIRNLDRTLEAAR